MPKNNKENIYIKSSAPEVATSPAVRGLFFYLPPKFFWYLNWLTVGHKLNTQKRRELASVQRLTADRQQERERIRGWRDKGYTWLQIGRKLNYSITGARSIASGWDRVKPRSYKIWAARDLLARGVARRAIAERLGVSLPTVKRWREVLIRCGYDSPSKPFVFGYEAQRAGLGFISEVFSLLLLADKSFDYFLCMLIRIS